MSRSVPAREDAANRRCETGGIGEERDMVARHVGDASAQLLGERERRLLGELPGRLPTDADDHTGGGRAQGVDVGLESGRRLQLTGQEPRTVERVLLGHLRRRTLGVFIEAGGAHELRERGAQPVAVVGRHDVIGVRAVRGGIRQQLEHGRLVCDEGADTPGMTLHDRESRHRAAARAEQVRGPGTEIVENGDNVIRSQFGNGVLVGVVDGAVRDAARVDGDDRVIGCEFVGEVREVR